MTVFQGLVSFDFYQVLQIYLGAGFVVILLVDGVYEGEDAAIEVMG